MWTGTSPARLEAGVTIRQWRQAQQQLATHVAARWVAAVAAVGTLVVAPTPALAQTPVIDTWAGGGPPAGAVAATVSLGSPNSVAKDALDNYYIASSDADLVYRVDSAGLLSVFAGGGTRQGNAADGHPALEAALNRPSHIVWFANGLHVVEGQRIRRIDTQTGIVSTVMGGGTLPFTDGIPAVDITSACPSGLAISLTGDIYYTDLCDNTIKRIDTAGLVTRVAGVPADPGGFGGDGGPAALALFRRPEELALDPDSGDLAVIDQAHRAETGRVRRISAGSDGVVTGAADETIVSVTAGGCCNVGPGNNGQLALLADMRGLTAISFDDGRILVGQTYEGPGFLWRIQGNGVLELVAGVDSQTTPGAPGFGDGNGRLAINARFGVLAGITLASNLEILIADRALHAVRRIDGIGAVYRIAGNGAASLSGDGGPAAGAQLYRPSAIQFDAAGNAVIVDQDRGRLRRIDAATGAIASATPLMPNGSTFRPLAIALHPATGHIYFANGDERIHAFDPGTGSVTVVAGTGRRTCSWDCEGGDPIDDLGDFGLATNATFNSPVSLVFDAGGNLYLADLGNHRVRRIDAATGLVRTVAGIDIAGSGGYGGDGGPSASARLRNPWAVALGPDGTLFIADTGNDRIRAVAPQANGSPSTGSGAISTVVNGFAPRALAADGAGRLFFGGSGYADVRVWDGANVSVYVNSRGIPGFSGDGGPAIDGRISTARGLAVYGGALFIADDNNHRIRVVRAGGGAPDLVILKGTTSTFQQGGTATYDLDITNSGTAATTGLYTITDVFPAGLTASGASGAGWDCSASTTTTISCSSGDVLAPGQAAPVVTIGVNIAATAPASITNTASVAGGGETDTTNNTSSVTSPVTQLVPDLTITKSTTSPFQQGGTATYDLVVRNSGNGPSSGGYTIADVLPAGLTLAGTTAGAGWDCTASTAAVVSCTRGTPLSAGQAAPTVAVTVNIATTAPASIANTASVAGGGDTDTANNTSSVTSPVTQLVPDLTITKSTTSAFVQGGTASYDLVVRNVGNGPTTGAYTITDALPAGLTLAGTTPGAGWVCTASTTTVVSCARSTTLPAGQTATTVTIAVDVAATAPASVTNTGSVAGGSETDATNNTSSVTNPVTQLVPDVTITKSTTSTFLQGSTANYVLVVGNGGNGPTTGPYTITDVLPAGLTLARTTPGAGWDCTASTTTVVGCTRNTTLPAGQAASTVTITVDIAATAPASITNTASVAGGGETDTANNTSSVTSVVTPAVPDLTIAKLSTSTFQAGGTAIYMLTVRNSGNGPTSGAYTITDVLPAGLSLAGTTPGTGWDCTASTTTVVSCTRSTTLPAGQTAPTVTITVDIAATATASITNTATITGGGETNTANNSSTVTYILAGSGTPDLALTKATASTTFIPGGTATYTFTVRNVGTGPTRAAYTVTDQLPQGLQLAQSPTGAGWTCSVLAPARVTCTSSMVIPAGGTAPMLTIPVIVSLASTAAITNTAFVAGGGEAFATGNNLSTVTTPIERPDLALSIAASSPIVQGGTVTYTFTVANLGLGPAQTATLEMNFGWLPGPFSVAPGSGWTCTSPTSFPVRCARSTSIAPGESTSSTVTVPIPAWFGSTATVAARVVTYPDTNYANNSAFLSSPVTAVGPDPTISAVASGPLQQGGTVSYTLTVTNQGSAVATLGSFWVVNPNPAGLVFTAASGAGWACTISSGAFLCRPTAPLAAGATAPVITATATVALNAAASITNRSIVLSLSDIDTSNNQSLVTSSVAPR